MQPALYPQDFRTALIPPASGKRRRNPRTVTMPERVGPHVKLVFAEMARQKLRYLDVAERSGVQHATLKAWRKKNRAGLESLEAVLATLGFGLVPVAALEALDPELAGELIALALKMRMNVPQTWAALIDIGVEQKLLRMRAEDRAAILVDHDARMAGHANDNVKQQRGSEVASSTK
ncbi:transposase [Bradyrhizobium sp. WSM1417]|uniref:transposase n=1 Tax=Bradyrhizobium sp. WSM1417 TaxID=754500 RepID=UPI0012EC71D1|nr:transposase [Bradyrhizobium sp. WSM1417]